jgi:hypothetical protein
VDWTEQKNLTERFSKQLILRVLSHVEHFMRFVGIIIVISLLIDREVKEYGRSHS